MSTDAPPDPVGAAGIFYEVAVRKLSDQLQSIESLDAKSAALFAFASGSLVLRVANGRQGE